MCRYCSYQYHDGWTQLLDYDETFQRVIAAESQSTYGFHESWEELREDVSYGT
jgi:hypothetical protein